jgi:hypothetical protein
MAKGMTQKKATKKKPAKSMKEKRADKVAKKKGWYRRRIIDHSDRSNLQCAHRCASSQAMHVDGVALEPRST